MPETCVKVPHLTVIILTHNENCHIERAIRSVASFASAVVVADSHSTDNTCEIAESLGAIVLKNKWINYATQFQWAIDNLPIKTDWLMRLDADEVVSPGLALTLRNRIASAPQSVSGFRINRKHVFWGKWIRFGGRSPLWLLRIWRFGQGRIEHRWMDEHILVDRGAVIDVKGDFFDINLKDITFFTTKHNGYATREAIDKINQRYGLFQVDSLSVIRSAGYQAHTRRIMKEKVYNHLPVGLGPLLYFIWRYFFQLGFMDGREGLVYHFLQGFWYRLLVEAKAKELSDLLAEASSNAQRIEILRVHTGLALDYVSTPTCRQHRVLSNEV